MRIAGTSVLSFCVRGSAQTKQEEPAGSSLSQVTQEIQTRPGLGKVTFSYLPPVALNDKLAFSASEKNLTPHFFNTHSPLPGKLPFKESKIIK